jgi:hypothetical protein
MPALNLRLVESSKLETPRLDSGVMPVSDRPALAAAALKEAEGLLAKGFLEQAGERFQAAARTFDEIGDAAGGARALLGLGRVLLGLEDPVCREVLEDAGTWLEDLGDDAAVREVDGLLRVAEASISESPRSFHAVPMTGTPSGYVRTSSAPPPSREE